MERQKEFFDGLTLRHVIAYEKDTGHGFSGANPIVSEVGNGIAIVSKEDAFFFGCPSQDDGIGVSARLAS